MAAAEDEAPFRWFTVYGSTGVQLLEATPTTGGRVTLTLNDSGTAGTDMSILGGDGIESERYAPLTTLGVRLNHKWGISMGLEAQHSRFRDAFSAPATLAPGTVTLTNFATTGETSSVKAETTDFYVNASYTRWGATVKGLAGLRQASFAAEGEIESFGVFTTGNFVNLSFSNGSAFEGDGKLYGFGVSYKIPRTFISVFFDKKWSKLDGESDSFGRSVGTVASSPSAPLVGAATVTRNNVAATKMKVRGFEAGIQLDFEPTAKWNIQSFVRLGYSKANWELDGPPTGGAGFGGTIGTLTTNGFASAGLGDLELTGYSLAVGIAY